jgi:hypothetical protein
MPARIARNSGGRGTKPNRAPSGLQGSISAPITTSTVASTRLRAGALANIGRCVRTTSTTQAAETTDSMNQPVRNSAASACSTKSSTAKVR